MNLLALNPMILFAALPGNIAQGIIWGMTAKMLRALARSYREEIWKPEREKQNFCPAAPDSD